MGVGERVGVRVRLRTRVRTRVRARVRARALVKRTAPSPVAHVQRRGRQPK